jgi:predicted ATPase
MQGSSIETSIDLQNGVLASIERHLDGVSERCRAVLVWAAVIGSGFEFALLAAVTGVERQELLDLLEEANRAHLAAPHRDGGYRFVVPLVGTMLLKTLSASERAARHEKVASALEVIHASALDMHTARIARHFFRAAPAGNAEKAFGYSVKAARHAEQRGDARGAVKQWAQAARSLDLIPRSDAARLEVQLCLARAHARAEDKSGARDAFFDAAMLARALDDPASLVDAAIAFAALSKAGDPRREALLAQAHDVTEGADKEGMVELTRKLAQATQRVDE